MFTLGTFFNAFLAPRLGKIIGVVLLLAIAFYLMYAPYKQLKGKLKAQQDSTALYKGQLQQLTLTNRALVQERAEWHHKYYEQVLLRKERVAKARDQAVEQPLKQQLVTFAKLTGQPAPFELKAPLYSYQVTPTFYQAPERGPLVVMDSTTFAKTLGTLAEQKQTIVEDSTLLKTCALIKVDAKAYLLEVEAEVSRARLINIPSLKRRLTKVFDKHEALRKNLTD